MKNKYHRVVGGVLIILLAFVQPAFAHQLTKEIAIQKHAQEKIGEAYFSLVEVVDCKPESVLLKTKTHSGKNMTSLKVGESVKISVQTTRFVWAGAIILRLDSVVNDKKNCTGNFSYHFSFNL